MILIHVSELLFVLFGGQYCQRMALEKTVGFILRKTASWAQKRTKNPENLAQRRILAVLSYISTANPKNRF